LPPASRLEFTAAPLLKQNTVQKPPDRGRGQALLKQKNGIVDNPACDGQEANDI